MLFSAREDTYSETSSSFCARINCAKVSASRLESNLFSSDSHHRVSEYPEVALVALPLPPPPPPLPPYSQKVSSPAPSGATLAEGGAAAGFVAILTGGVALAGAGARSCCAAGGCVPRFAAGCFAAPLAHALPDVTLADAGAAKVAGLTVAPFAAADDLRNITQESLAS
jgi:hypothetical protein